jgi:hypothetical protein
MRFDKQDEVEEADGKQRRGLPTRQEILRKPLRLRISLRYS